MLETKALLADKASLEQKLINLDLNSLIQPIQKLKQNELSLFEFTDFLKEADFTSIFELVGEINKIYVKQDFEECGICS